jgi:hypothetical protein
LPLSIGADFLAYLDTYPAAHLQWVAFTRADTPRFGNASALIKLRLDMRALVVATDGAGGFLLFFPDDEDDDTQSTGGAAMTTTPDDPREQLASEIAAHQHKAFVLPTGDEGFLNFVKAEVKAAQMVELASSAEQIAPTPTPAPDDDEEEKRKGRGGAENPAFATLAHNIRPEVMDAPGGLVTVTTAKSADYKAQPDEPEPENVSSYFRSQLVAAERGTLQEPQGQERGAQQETGNATRQEPATQIDERQSALVSAIGVMRDALHSRDDINEAQRLEYKDASKAHDSEQLDIAERIEQTPDVHARTSLRLESLAASFSYAGFLADTLAHHAERDGDLAAAEAYGKAASGFRTGHHETHDAWYVSYTQEYAARGDERAQAWLVEHGHAEPDNAAHDSPAVQQANEQSTTRQDAERKERSGEASADPSLSASDRLAAQLEGGASKAERDAEEAAPELAPLEPIDGGRGGAGRGMF